MRVLFLVPLCLCLAACSNDTATIEDFNSQTVTLPDGTKVKAEVMMNPKDMMRGMMFRDTFPEGKAMLFIHNSPTNQPYWMYQVKVPLDIVWMDKNHRVVEMVENAPPCKTEKASGCPNYGGNRTYSFVIELPGGYARKHGVREGEVLQF
jgi:uncharacterized membrane protein (UPF0127 family)